MPLVRVRRMRQTVLTQESFAIQPSKNNLQDIASEGRGDATGDDIMQTVQDVEPTPEFNASSTVSPARFFLEPIGAGSSKLATYVARGDIVRTEYNSGIDKNVISKRKRLRISPSEVMGPTSFTSCAEAAAAVRSKRKVKVDQTTIDAIDRFKRSKASPIDI